MKLETLLLQKKSSIVNRWVNGLLETYPSDTSRFMKKQKDQFANPVGYTITKEIENLYEEFLQGLDTERISPILDRIIRIRAVQDFSPSRAIAFIFLLKRVTREELEKEILENRLADELLEFESRVDDLSLLAFDIYMKCREKVYEIKANQAKNQVSKLLQRSGLIDDVPKWEPDLKEGRKK